MACLDGKFEVPLRVHARYTGHAPNATTSKTSFKGIKNKIADSFNHSKVASAPCKAKQTTSSDVRPTSTIQTIPKSTKD